MKAPFSAIVRYFLLTEHWPEPHEEAAAALIERACRRALREAA